MPFSLADWWEGEDGGLMSYSTKKSPGNILDMIKKRNSI